MSSLRSGIKQVKVERPRPLKIGGGTQPELGVEDLVSVVDNVRKTLSSSEAGDGGFAIVGQLKILSANLRLTGSSLETNNKVILMKTCSQAKVQSLKSRTWTLLTLWSHHTKLLKHFSKGPRRYCNSILKLF